jgi:hypothetical protein
MSRKYEKWSAESNVYVLSPFRYDIMKVHYLIGEQVTWLCK